MDFNLDKYVDKANTSWQNFNSYVSCHKDCVPFRDCSDAENVFTVPECGLFCKNENISISIHPINNTGGLPPKSDFFHHHDFFELNYVPRGVVKNTIEGTPVILDSASLLMMNPQAVHNPQPETDNTVLFNILIRRQWIEQSFINFLTFSPSLSTFFLDSIYIPSRQTPYLIFELTQPLSDILNNIIMEFYDQKPCVQSVLFALLIELLAQLTRQQEHVQKVQDLQYINNRSIDDIMKYIRNNYKSVSLTELSEKFYYSTGYLSRMIKESCRMTFSEIIHNLKINNACNYLQFSDLPIDTISELIGFSDTGYFIKSFRKKKFMTPKQWRIKYKYFQS